MASEENKIPRWLRILFNFVTFMHLMAVVIFSLCLAVQPEDAFTLKIHTLPFSNLIFWLIMEQVCIVWFGWLVSWTEKDEEGNYYFPKWYPIASAIHVTLQGLQGLIHILYQVCNAGFHKKAKSGRPVNTEHCSRAMSK